LAILERVSPDSADHAQALAGIAAAARAKGQFGEASRLYGNALDDLDRQTTRLGGGSESRAGFRARHERYYREYIDVLLAQNKPDAAFHVQERSRARTLLETLAAAHVDTSKGADPDLLKKEQALQTEIKGKSERRIRLLSAKHTELEVNSIEQEI